MKKLYRLLTNWEQWNFFMLYLPIFPVWGWYCIKTQYVEPDTDPAIALAAIRTAGFELPFVVKPDVGMKGILFRKIDQWQQWEHYHRQLPVTYLVQELVDYPTEISVFYYRFPGAEKGVISGCIQKELLQVTGNGRSSLQELIAQHPRASLRWQEMRHRHQDRFDGGVTDVEIYFL